MPEGYYSGDKPNSNLRAFVENHIKENPYDPKTDDYNVPAFDKPIETTKATAIYNMHTYWSKKPHDAIRQYIRHYTKPGDLVLDPFCGSGGTNLAALMEGRKTIAIDRSPAATFITKNYCTSPDVNELQAAFEELKRKVTPEIDWLYETRCDRCGGKATTAYTVYSQVFQCPRCMGKVPLFDCVEVEGQTSAGKPKKVSVCPHCYGKGINEEIITRTEKFGSIPVLVSYLCNDGCKPVRGERRRDDSVQKKREYFEKCDLEKIREIERMEIPYWTPPHKMMNVEDDSIPWGEEWREGRNFRYVTELFTKRNLWALASCLSHLPKDKDLTTDFLRFAFSATLLNVSKLIQVIKSRRSANSYYLPQISKEIQVWESLSGKIHLLDGLSDAMPLAKANRIMVSTQTACDLSQISSASIDYIFTDPPYAGKIQYGELNFIWESWLNLDTNWHNEEITVSQIRHKTDVEWASMMLRAAKECYRILKPGRWLSLCYHDTSEGTWSQIQDIMAEVGFLIDKNDSAVFIDTGGTTYNQTQADKVNKRDLVINFRKPKPRELGTKTKSGGVGKTFREETLEIIYDYLEAYPGSTKDRVYDEVVSRLVRAGRMEAHNFEELLRQVAEEIREPIRKDLFRNEDPNLFGTHEISRWYLRESQIDIIDTAESAKEDFAAENVHIFVEKHLTEHPEKEGVHYSDIFEHFIYVVRDKPRRPLAEWLLDYFYKTDEGTYRLPISEEEKKLKAEGRSKGTNRQIKRYIAFLEQGVTIPEKERPNDATLAEWIRHCKRSGIYEQGKLLYERGGLNLDNLPEEAMVNVEEDYQICIRMLSRVSGKK